MKNIVLFIALSVVSSSATMLYPFRGALKGQDATFAVGYFFGMLVGGYIVWTTHA